MSAWAVFAVATLFILSVTLLPLSRNRHWLIRGMDFPRLQFAVFAFLLLVAEWIWLDPDLSRSSHGYYSS